MHWRIDSYPSDNLPLKKWSADYCLSRFGAIINIINLKDKLNKIGIFCPANNFQNKIGSNYVTLCMLMIAKSSKIKRDGL